MAKKNKEVNIEDLELDEAEEAVTKKGKKVKAEKSAPAADKKADKKAKAAKEPTPDVLGKGAGLHRPLPEGYIGIQELSEEFGKTPKDIRTALREGGLEKPESGRWGWHPKKDAAALKQVRSILSTVGTRKPKAEKVEAAPAKGGKEGKKAKEEAKPSKDKASKKK